MRVERRGGGFLGRTSFGTIHTRPTVAREPSLEVYRAVREARKILVMSDMTSTGKGLNHFTQLATGTTATGGMLGADCVNPFPTLLNHGSVGSCTLP